MSFNVQLPDIEGSLSLLEWINSQRYQKGIKGHLISFQKVLQEGSIYQILATIDEGFFGNLQFQSKNKKIDIIQKYLDRQFGKRMRWNFKQSLGNFDEQNNIKELAKLSCYFGVHSNKKNDYINRILKLTERSQNYLMEQMQTVENKLQNIMQIKEILEQIELLEQQNQQLKQKLEQMSKANSEMLSLVKDTQTQNNKLKQETKKYREQKCEVLTALKIDYISEYLDIYNRLRKQNEANLEYIRELQLKLQSNVNYSIELNERIKCDCLVINSLSDEISKLKSLCSQNSTRWSFESMNGYSGSKLNVLKSASSNKQNMSKSKCSTKMGISLDVPFHSSEWVTSTDNQDEFNQLQSMRAHNRQLMGKLEEMYKKYHQLNSETVELRDKNKKITSNYIKMKDVLKNVESAQNQFEFKYAAASKEYKITIDNRLAQCL